MHASMISRLALVGLSCLALPSLFACLDHPLKKVEYEQIGLGGGSIPLTVNRDVDILFVVDNSGSMGEEQATLAANFASFIDVLERPDVAANYRIGITTTDNGNPWCPGTGPEAGALRLTSCRQRPGEFIYAGVDSVDVTDEACYDVCPEEWTNIEIQPSEIFEVEGAKARPWLENIGGKTNLPDGLSTVQAFQCFGPQGIDGCGFESHLESMYKTLERSERDTEAEYGFIRDHAILSIIHVTDEEDCSHNTAHDSIFLPDGGRVFWSDPEDPQPSSAVCWNAGVACDGGDCRAVDHGIDGEILGEGEDASADAVLRPVSRYIERVQELISATAEQEGAVDKTVLVALIGGVQSDGSVSYQSSVQDEGFLADFGIGPGCSSDNGLAVPPVRLKEFADAFRVGPEDDKQRNMFSICDADYSLALEAIAQAIADQVKPACMPDCVEDTKRDTPELDPVCILTQHTPIPGGDIEESSVPECTDNESLPEDADVCYRTLVGEARSQECIDMGFNLEFELLRREGIPVPGGTGITATCELSPLSSFDCPDLM